MTTSRCMGLIATVLFTVGISHGALAASTSSGSAKATIGVSAFIVEHCTASNETAHRATNVDCTYHSAYTVQHQSAPSSVEMLPGQQGVGEIVTVTY